MGETGPVADARRGALDAVAGKKAWAQCLRRSDLVFKAMGVEPAAAAAAAKDCKPIAVSDASKRVHPIKRAYLQLVLKPYAR